MNAMKLYTKRGDAGQTDLYGGQRVGKDSLRVEAYGTVDELNSVIGLAVATGSAVDVSDEVYRVLLGGVLEPLTSIQSRLFEIGADLSTPPSGGRAASVPRVEAGHVLELEGWIDRAAEAVPPMQHFVLPGGTGLAAQLHVARTVCRRAERVCVTLAGQDEVGDQVVVYLNRLSDLLFVWARQANALMGVADVPWKHSAPGDSAPRPDGGAE